MGIGLTGTGMKTRIRLAILAAAACSALHATAATYTIGGKLSGLKSGASVTLLNNGGNALKLTHTGSFTFTKALASGAAYDVSVGVQPAGQVCSVTVGTGKVKSADIKNIVVSCVTGYSIGGTASGLVSKNAVVLELNGADPLTVSKNANFTFTALLATSASYKVSIKTQPVDEVCTLSGPSGKVHLADVKTVKVTCALRTFSIGGTVSGLAAGKSFTLLDNHKASLPASKNGGFTFKTLLAFGAAYDVTIGTQPAGETCTVKDGTGHVALKDVTTVVVTCTSKAPPPTYSVGGTVSGLNSGVSVTLLNSSDSDSVTVAANGSFTFPKKETAGSPYNISVGTQPTGETCQVANGSGNVGSANLASVAVTCSASSTPMYSIGGSVSGLSSGASVTLTLNGGDSTPVSSNTSFTFSTQLATGANYNIQVKTQPTGETCDIGGGVGIVASANITNVKVTCSASSGGGGSPFWIPFAEAPDVAATGGVNAIAVLPSGNISSSPNLDTVITGSFEGVDFTFEYDLNGGVPTYIPQLLVYRATDKNGNLQLYTLSLKASATAPVPAQLGNIAVSSTQSVCGSKLVQTDLTNPAAFFVILDIGGTICDGESDTFEVVHSGDSATTSPTAVNLTSTDVDVLYSNAKMTGMVLSAINNNEPEPNNTDVNFFADDTFTNPTTLFSKIYTEDDMSVGALRKLSTFSSEGLYILITPTGSSPSTLYLIDDSGGSTAIATAANADTFFVDSGTADDSNIYYFTTSTANSVTTETLYQVPVGGGAPMQLFQKQLASGENLSLLGSNDTDVVFQDSLPISGNTPASVGFYSVPVGKSSSSATPLNATPYQGTISTVNGFMVTPNLTDLSGSVVLVNIKTTTGTGNTAKTAYSSIALQPGSTSSATPAANTVYGAFGTLGSAATGLAWQITGITDTNGGMGGGTLNLTDVSTLDNTPLTTVGGGNYIVPAGYHSSGGSRGSLSAISSTGIAGGVLLNENERTVSSSNPANKYGAIGLAIDLNAGFVLPEEVPATDVETF